MNSQEERAAAVVAVIILEKQKKRSRKKQKSWVKPWISRRNKHGIYNNLIQELRHEDINEYKRFLKMTPEVFDELLSYIEIDITKQTTVLREPTPVKMKLEATLYYLSTGKSYSHLQHIFRIHKTTIGQFFPEVCDATSLRLKGKYLMVRHIKLK